MMKTFLFSLMICLSMGTFGAHANPATPANSTNSTTSDLQEAQQLRQYLENVLGAGVQINVTREAGRPAQHQRQRTHTRPQLRAESNSTVQDTLQNTEQRRQTQSKKSWLYDTTETLSQSQATTGKRSVTVVYPARPEQNTAEVEQLITTLLNLQPDETLVIQAYTPPTTSFSLGEKQDPLWLWALICIGLGIGLGLGGGFYWRRRQNQKQTAYEMAYNEAPESRGSTPYLHEDSYHAPEL